MTRSTTTEVTRHLSAAGGQDVHPSTRLPGSDQHRLCALRSLLLCLVVGLLGGAPAAAVQYVSVTYPDCGGASPCYANIQSAVNAATTGEEVRVAAGTYTGVALVTLDSITYEQVVMITDSLALQGGYSIADWSTPDPVANPTIIDAEAGGRCVTIVGDHTQTVTVAGFTLERGDYTGLGNPDGVVYEECQRAGEDCGGGLYANRVKLHLSDCILRDNYAGTDASAYYSAGGGAFLWYTNAGTTIDSTTFSLNSALENYGVGGGLALINTNSLTISDCVFAGNSAAEKGGGLYVTVPSGPITVEDTTGWSSSVGDVA